MGITILDCYTDEPAGLGVPPYLGTYPRYIAGYLGKPATYATIDDLRFYKRYGSVRKEPKKSEKTDIYTYNLTVHADAMKQVLATTDTLIIVLGVHVPGRYLSAVPGTVHEVMSLLKDEPCKKILTGPAIFGTQLQGGKLSEQYDSTFFDKVDPMLYRFAYEDVAAFAVAGASIIKQIPYPLMIEIETGRGCDIGKCSFCTEPLKNAIAFRKKEDVLAEIREFYRLGARFFRLGKQTCFYTYPDAVPLLESIRRECPDISVLHIDNVNPVKVMKDHREGDRITKAIVEHCTSGNIAAFGIESFDKEVVRANTLNTLPEVGYQAIRVINSYGSQRGEDGMPRFLPGINILFGLRGETKKTHEENMRYLQRVYDEGLMVRRINIRKIAVFPGTSLAEKDGDKYLKKNKRHYFRWRDDIRQKIDFPMLQRVVPSGTVMKGCYAEIYDGNTTFCRQFGTYPLVVGVKGRLELKKFYDVRVTGHMLRSITGVVAN